MNYVIPSSKALVILVILFFHCNSLRNYYHRGAFSRLSSLLHYSRIEKRRGDRITVPACTSINLKAQFEEYHQPKFVQIGFNNVYFGFSTASVVQNATFDICTGHRVGIVGPNGTGKVCENRNIYFVSKIIFTCLELILDNSIEVDCGILGAI